MKKSLLYIAIILIASSCAASNVCKPNAGMAKPTRSGGLIQVKKDQGYHNFENALKRSKK